MSNGKRKLWRVDGSHRPASPYSRPTTSARPQNQLRVHVSYVDQAIDPQTHLTDPPNAAAVAQTTQPHSKWVQWFLTTGKVWWIPLLLLLLVTIVFRCTDADIATCGLFYDFNKKAWPFALSHPYYTVKSYGIYPSLVLAVAGLLLLPISLLWKGLRRYREAGLFFGLFLLLGPGLVVNVALKDHWGRPRPHQVEAFHGPLEFIPVWGISPYSHHNSSFPSGHAAVAFYMIAPWFVLFEKRPRLARFFLVLGFGWGTIMGMVRVIQGGHFPSDVLWSAGFVYFTGIALWRGLQASKQIAWIDAFLTQPSEQPIRTEEDDGQSTIPAPHFARPKSTVSADAA